MLYPFVKEQITDDQMYYILLDEVQLLGEFESVLNGFMRISNSFDLTSVDPRNFAQKVREMTIEVINKSVDFKATEMDVYWYNRTTLGNRAVSKKGELDNGEFRYSVGRFSINKNRVFSIYLK